MNDTIRGFTGYQIYKHARRDLLLRVPPVFDTVIAHHITDKFNVAEQLPAYTTYARIVATAASYYIQAAIVEINGAMYRDDGSIYHITISYDNKSGAKSADALAAIVNNDWQHITPFTIHVTPKFFRFYK